MTRGHDNGYEEPGGLSEPSPAGGPLLDGLRSHEGVIDAEMVTGP